MSFPTPPPRQLPACDTCFIKKTRCDRKDPCFNCATAKITCLRRRPRQTGMNRNNINNKYSCNPSLIDNSAKLIGASSDGRDNDRLDAVLERMTRLEESLTRTSSSRVTSEPEDRRTSTRAASHTSDALTPTSDPQAWGQGPEWPSPVSRSTASRNWQPVSRKRVAESTLETSRTHPRNPSQPPPLPEEASQSPEDRVLASLDLNRYLRPIGGSVRSRETDPSHQSVLESAIRLAKQAMSEPDLKYNDDQRHNPYEPSMYPSAEFLHLLLHVRNTSGQQSKGAAPHYFLGLFASCTNETLEQMALALIECTVHGQERTQYLICVNHVAYSFITALHSSPSPGMRRELQRSKARYRDNILMAVNKLDTTIRPDISLLYALQSGAQLMQDIGRMRMCWKLNTLSCKVAAALRGHSLVETGLSRPDDIVTFRVACIRSYIYDTALSANNYQPACLAKMDIERSILDTENPGDAMLSILLSLSEVQEIIILETRKLAAPGQTQQLDTVRLARLRPQMRDIRAEAKNYRDRPQSRNDAYLQFEWETIDFIYYSVMTTLTRLSSASDDPVAHQQCLANARKCLATLQRLLETTAAEPQQDRYISSLAWIVPLFPLRPLYFVFANVVGISDNADIRLLRNLTEALEGPAQVLHSILEVHHMCTSLLDLYDDYIERSANYSQDELARQSETSRPANSAEYRNISAQTHGIHRAPGAPMLPPGYQASTLISGPGQQEYGLGMNVSAHHGPTLMAMGVAPSIDPIYFDDQVNWELFFAQPTMELL